MNFMQHEGFVQRGGVVPVSYTHLVCAQPHPKLQMLEQVKDAVLARALHAPRFVDGRYLVGTFQAACSAPVSYTHLDVYKRQYHTQAAGCSDKARAKASGGRQPIEECGRTGL